MATPLALHLLCYYLILVATTMVEGLVVNKIAGVRVARTDAAALRLAAEVVAEQTVHAGTFVNVVVHLEVVALEALFTVTL